MYTQPNTLNKFNNISTSLIGRVGPMPQIWRTSAVQQKAEIENRYSQCWSYNWAGHILCPGQDQTCCPYRSSLPWKRLFRYLHCCWAETAVAKQLLTRCQNEAVQCQPYSLPCHPRTNRSWCRLVCKLGDQWMGWAGSPATHHPTFADHCRLPGRSAWPGWSLKQIMENLKIQLK